MIFALRNAALRTFFVNVRKPPSALNGIRVMTIDSQLANKKKAEEDRYIRQKEHEAYLARNAKEETAKLRTKGSTAEKTAKAEFEQAVSEVFGVLSITNEKLSDAAVEHLANWKLGKE